MQPSIPATAYPASGSRQATSFALLFAACLAGLVLKSPDTFLNPQFWAEDAVIFFRQQWGHDWPRLLVDYAGYLHSIPRLVAWAAGLVPVAWAPALYNYAALLLGSASLTYFCWRLESPLLGSLALAGVILAPTNGEVFGTLTNSQWFLQFFLLAACFLPATPAQSGTRRTAMALAVLAVALTGPFSTLLLLVHCILAGGSLVARCYAPARWLPAYLRSLDRARLSALWIGGLLQVVTLVLADHQPAVDASVRTMLAAVGGMAQTHTFGVRLFPVPLFMLALTVLAVLTACWRRVCCEPGDRGLLLAAFGLAVLEIASGTSKPGLVSEAIGGGDRYFVLFKPVLWMLVFVVLGGIPRIGRTAAWAITMTCILLVSIFNRAHLQRRPMVDLDWASAVRTLQPDRESEIDINPVPWKVKLPPKSEKHP